MTIYGKYSGNLSTCNLAIPNMILSIASHGSDLARLIASLKPQGIKPVGTDTYYELLFNESILRRGCQEEIRFETQTLQGNTAELNIFLDLMNKALSPRDA